MRKACLVFLFMSLLPVFSLAVDPLHPSPSYSSSVPAPEALLGYKLGSAFTPYDQLEKYFQALAASSPAHLKLEGYGKSVEGRTLYTLTITSEKNLARLDAIRNATTKLSDPRKASPAEAAQIASSMPVVVWLSYNIHGNESNSSEAAMQVAYELAASEDTKVKEWLENAVIIIDPLENPDGRERYVQFYRTAQGTEPRSDRFSAEHDEHWPGGRYNHYLFDLNRDWAWQSQQESQARVKAYLRWNPQVFVDLHEMNAEASYYFAPPAGPVLSTISPLLSKWFQIYGQANAAAFDRYGFRYFTREGYDLFYPSYGDSWPSLNGAVGMTYEQAGGGDAGVTIDLQDEQRTLSLRDRIERHFTASLTTVDTSVKHRAERLRDFYEFRRAAIKAGEDGPLRAYYLLPGSDPQRLAHAVQILLREGIEVKRLEVATDLDDAIGYFGEKPARKHLPVGTYAIDLAQPDGFLARSLLDPENKPDLNYFYDVSAWSLPYALGIEAYTSGKPLRARASVIEAAPVEKGTVSRLGNDGNGGSATTAAYVISWEQSAAMPVLARLLSDNYKTFVTLKPSRQKDAQGKEKDLPAGSIVLPIEGNLPSLTARITQLAEENHCQVFAVPTLLADNEGTDLGSNKVRFLRKPRVAMLMDSPINASDYGSLWFLLEKQIGLPFSPIRAESLRDTDLNQYNVLILPPDSGDGRSYTRLLDKTRISEWVNNGGLLIGIRGGAVWATKRRAGIASTGFHWVRRDAEEQRIEEERASAKPGEPREDEPQPSKEEKEKLNQAKLERKLMKYADREQDFRRELIPGTVLRVNVDNTHPLGFGLPEQMAVLDRTAPILELTAKGENPAYFVKDNMKLSGFISPENEKKLSLTAYALRERIGAGHVVLFADNPTFRGHWDATARMLANAIFFGHVVDPNVR
jgi:Zinc carboxypeptidase